MTVKPKWDGNALMLGKTKMAEVREFPEGWRWCHSHGAWREPYEEKTDAMQDCEAEVRRLLRQAECEGA